MKNKTTYQDNREQDAKQFQEVLETWKQLLNARMEENVLRKNKISEIVKNNYDQNFLDEIEEFQTQFITEDEVIHSMRRDVNDLDNQLCDKLFEDGKTGKLFVTKIENLRKDIANSVIRFCNLQSAFSDFEDKISRKRDN